MSHAVIADRHRRTGAGVGPAGNSSTVGGMGQWTGLRDREQRLFWKRHDRTVQPTEIRGCAWSLAAASVDPFAGDGYVVA